MDRSAPVNGYDFGAKRDYRRKVWGKLLKHLPADGLIAMLPSAEGDEPEYLLSKNIPAERMVFIDRNPAIAATLSRRFRPAKSYGCDVAQAVLRMKSDGIRLAAFNMDLCGPVSPKLHKAIETLTRTRCIVDGGSVAITAMKGREHGRSWEFVQAFLGAGQHYIPMNDPIHAQRMPNVHDTSMARVSALAYMLTANVTIEAETKLRLVFRDRYCGVVTGHGEYPSGNLRMIWMSMQLHEQPCVCDLCVRDWIYDNFGSVPTDLYGFARLANVRRLWLWKVFGEDVVRQYNANAFDAMMAVGLDVGFDPLIQTMYRPN